MQSSTDLCVTVQLYTQVCACCWLGRLVYGWRQQVPEAILDVTEAILSFHEINGFLSLQLGLSFELGLRLRLTNVIFVQISICHTLIKTTLYTFKGLARREILFRAQGQFFLFFCRRKNFPKEFLMPSNKDTSSLK